VGTDFSQEHLGSEWIDAWNLCQINTECAIEFQTEVEGFRPPGRFSRIAFLAQWLCGRINLRRQLDHPPLHLFIQILNHLLIPSIAFERLSQNEEMLRTELADERLHDRVFAGFNAPVAELRQNLRIAFSGQNRI